MNNKEHMEFLLKELSKLTHPINTRNLFKGVFTIEEFQESGKSGFEVDDTLNVIKLHLDLVYTQLKIDGTEYLPTKSSKILRKIFTVTNEDNIEDFYNQFYQDIIRSLALGTYKSNVGFFSHFILKGLEDEQA